MATSRPLDALAAIVRQAADLLRQHGDDISASDVESVNARLVGLADQIRETARFILGESAER